MSYHRSLRLVAFVALIAAAIVYGVVPRLTGASIHSPATPLTSGTALTSPDGAVPPSIHTMIRRGPLAVMLEVTPVDVGPVRFVASVWDHNQRMTHARVRLQLLMPTQAMFGHAWLATSRCAVGFCAQGTLQALGHWRVNVLVWLPGVPHGPVSIPFDVMNGANARFLFVQPPNHHFGPATVRLARAPDGSSKLRVRLRSGLAVRLVLDMPNMLSMGKAIYAASALPRGWYGVSLAFPMTGVTQVSLEVHAQGVWHPVCILLYDVDSAGHASLLTNTPD